jgi:uncharacterized protein YcnI
MIDYATNPGWQTTTHKGKVEDLTKEEAALNKEGVLEALCKGLKGKAPERGDATNGQLVLAVLDPDTSLVVMVKGVHQAKFFSSNPRDAGHIDQTHYQVRFQGGAHHIYVSPNMRQTWDIVQIT